MQPSVDHQRYRRRGASILPERKDSDVYRTECVGFGINLLSGNYEFACLVVIDDEKWWGRFGGQLQANWEVERVRLYSSRETVSLEIS